MTLSITICDDDAQDDEARVALYRKFIGALVAAADFAKMNPDCEWAQPFAEWANGSTTANVEGLDISQHPYLLVALHPDPLSPAQQKRYEEIVEKYRRKYDDDE